MTTIMVISADGSFTIDGTAERLLTPAEVARLFRVDPKTVTRWGREGKLSSIHTLGGHHRFRQAEVHALLKDSQTDADG